MATCSYSRTSPFKLPIPTNCAAKSEPLSIQEKRIRNASKYLALRKTAHLGLDVKLESATKRGKPATVTSFQFATSLPPTSAAVLFVSAGMVFMRTLMDQLAREQCMLKFQQLQGIPAGLDVREGPLVEQTASLMRVSAKITRLGATFCSHLF